MSRLPTFVALTLIAALSPLTAQDLSKLNPEDVVVVERTSGKKLEGVVEAVNETELVLRLKHGRITLPLAEIASVAPKAAAGAEPAASGEVPATPSVETSAPAAPPPGGRVPPAADILEDVLEDLIASEYLDAAKALSRLEGSAADPFLQDAVAVGELIAGARVHPEVIDLDTLREFVEVKAQLACPRCGGPGEVRCKNCKGRGEEPCKSCKSKGRVDCGSCDGAGKLACPKCQGSSRMECDDCGRHDGCGGTGLAPRPGKLRRYSGPNIPANCSGRGYAGYHGCGECNGGLDTCDTCDPGPTGLACGYKECRSCEGKKKLTCGACKGAKFRGKCTSCQGSKAVACTLCAGSGLKPEEPEEEPEEPVADESPEGESPEGESDE